LSHLLGFALGIVISAITFPRWLYREGVEIPRMKNPKIRVALVLASVALAALALGATRISYLAVNVNPGDQMSVHIDGTTLSSATSSAGDTFGIVAAQAFLAQGNVAVIGGAIGQGHVVSITPAKNDKPAALAIQLDWITAVDGQHIPIAATKKGDPLIFGAGGPYEQNFSKDKPVTVGPDFVFPGFVSEQRYIQINSSS
jgi:hypothetical protein